MTLRWYGDAVMVRLEKAAMRGVVKGTEALRTRMVERIMQPPKTGLLYPRGKGRLHRASAPGESPANDYGNLAKSITTSYDVPQLRGTVNVGMEYGPWLEYGTQTMPARPFARPALRELTPEIRQGIIDEIARETRK